MRGQTNASNIGGNVGSDTKPIIIVNGVAIAVPNEFVTLNTIQTITAKKRFNYHFDLAKQNIVDKQNEIRGLRESVEKDGKVIEEQRRTIEYLAGLVDTADIINGLSKEALAAMIANKGVQA